MRHVRQQLRQAGAELRAVARRRQRYLLRRAVQRVHRQPHLVVAGVVAERGQQALEPLAVGVLVLRLAQLEAERRGLIADC